VKSTKVPSAVAQAGAFSSISCTFLSASDQVFFTVILNTAFSHFLTVCVSFHTIPSRSFGFASVLSIEIFGSQSTTTTSVVSLSVTVVPEIIPAPSTSTVLV